MDKLHFLIDNKLKQRGEIYMLQITQLKVRVRLNKTDLTEVIANKLNIQINEILHYTVDKRSIDARKNKERIFCQECI